MRVSENYSNVCLPNRECQSSIKIPITPVISFLQKSNIKMVYSKESSKWKAYQFSDPFATNSFIVCNKSTNIFCRPDCDAVPKCEAKSEIRFVDFYEDALSLGFKPCKQCDPVNKPAIGVDLLHKCVNTINKEIGFMNPLVEEDEEFNNAKIKENILELKLLNKEHIMKVLNKGDMRRQLVPAISHSVDITSVNLSKNDSDHYRLVDLACRHLAHAAAVNLFFPKKYVDEDSSNKKKRRRGGVLGFKELAAKSKLSAWHFHRVFKSVTGLTPKTYGDKCNEFLEKYKDSEYVNYSQFNQSITPISQESSVENSPYEQSKKQKIDYGYAVDRLNSLPNLYNPNLDIYSYGQSIQPQQFNNFQMPTLTFDFQYQPAPEMYSGTSAGSLVQDSTDFSNMGDMNIGTANISPISLDVDEIQVPSIFKKDYKVDIPQNDYVAPLDSLEPLENVDFLNDLNFDDNLNDFLTSV